MTLTGQQILEQMLRRIGVLAAGQTPPGHVINDALSCVNLMLDSWKAQRWMMYREQRNTYALTPSTASYTIGSGGAFNQARPDEIVRAGFVSEFGTAQEFEWPVYLMTAEEYSRWPLKNQAGTMVHQAYYDPNYPLGTVHTFPIMSLAGYRLALYTKTQLDELVLATSYSFPPGYMEALHTNGALRLCDEFGKTPTEVLVNLASNGIALVKRNNPTSYKVGSDPAYRQGRLVTTQDIYQGHRSAV